jgi:hypothetical protein
VVLPKAEYERLTTLAKAADLPPLPAPDANGNVPAVEYARASLARKSIRARSEAGWTQPELADAAGVREKLTFDAEQDAVRFLWHHYEHCGYVKTPEDEYDDYLTDRHEDRETQKMGFNRGFVDAVKKIWEEIQPAFK